MSSPALSKNQRNSVLLGLAMFTMGGCGLAYEYTLSKIASDILGNSAQQWAIVIAVMLFFMGIGADLQRHITDKKLVQGLVVSQILLGILGGFGCIAMLYIYSLFPFHFIFVQYALISLIGLLIGFEIPLLTRINESFTQDVKTNLARILKMDYIGALCGALFWVFLLPRFFTMVETGFVLGFITLIIAGLCLYIFAPSNKQSTPYWFAIVLSFSGLAYGFHHADTWTHHTEQYLYRDRIVFSETSKYQHIVLTQARSGSTACYINGHLQFSSEDEHIYHENLVHPAMHIAQRAKRILILGGGDGLAAREVLKYDSVEEITLVDLDPEMTRLAQENPIFRQLNQDSLQHAKLKILKNGALLDSGAETLFVPNQYELDPEDNKPIAEINILNIDATKFVAQAQGKYDVIIIDFPDPNALELAKLYSQHFYGLVRNKLSADGIFIQQSTSPIHAKEAFLCIGRTMQSAGFSVVPFHDNVPSFGEWGWWIGGRQERYSPQALKERLENIEGLKVDTRYLTPQLIAASLQFGKNQLTTENEDINTITVSAVYDYYLEGWSKMNGL